MKLNKITSAIAVLFIFVIVSAFATANVGSVDVRYVRVNGEELDGTFNERITVSDNLDILVRLAALENVSDIEVTARVTGYEYSDRQPLRLYDVKVIKELSENDITNVRLSLDVPKDIRQQERALVIQIYSSQGQIAQYDAMLNIEGPDNHVEIRRVTFDPSQVVAGRALRTNVRLENLGERDEHDVFVTVAIPALGPNFKASADLDTLRQGRLTTTEDLLLRIPDCVEPGVYDVDVTVSFDNNYRTTTAREQITIIESADSICGTDTKPVDKTIITAPSGRDVRAGSVRESFPVVIRNEGTQDKTYVISVSGVESFGKYDISTAAPFVPAGSSQVVYVYLDTAVDATGQKTFVISVTDGSQVRSIPMNINIIALEEVPSSAFNWRQWLYAGVIILLILIVILGLAIGFKKVNNEDEEEYY